MAFRCGHCHGSHQDIPALKRCSKEYWDAYYRRKAARVRPQVVRGRIWRRRR